MPSPVASAALVPAPAVAVVLESAASAGFVAVAVVEFAAFPAVIFETAVAASAADAVGIVPFPATVPPVVPSAVKFP